MTNTEIQTLRLAAQTRWGKMAKQMLESGWNPITDNSDAVDLSTYLLLSVIYGDRGIQINVEKVDYAEDRIQVEVKVEVLEDGQAARNAAFRAAVTMAAALLEKNKGNN